MTDNEIEIWEKLVTDACTHYKLTNEIQDILLPGFDQMGRWSSTILIRDRSKAHIAKLIGATIPLDRLVSKNKTGESILLCSFVDDSDGVVTIPYHHVKGSILTRRCLRPGEM
jgi:hypothetical protein